MKEVYEKLPDGTYKKLGQPFTGFPSNGVWFVKDGSQNLIMYMDDMGKKPIPYIDIMKHKKEIEDEVYNLLESPYSVSEIVDKVLDCVSNRVAWEEHI